MVGLSMLGAKMGDMFTYFYMFGIEGHDIEHRDVFNPHSALCKISTGAS